MFELRIQPDITRLVEHIFCLPQRFHRRIIECDLPADPVFAGRIGVHDRVAVVIAFVQPATDQTEVIAEFGHEAIEEIAETPGQPLVRVDLSEGNIEFLEKLYEFHRIDAS